MSKITRETMSSGMKSVHTRVSLQFLAFLASATAIMLQCLVLKKKFKRRNRSNLGLDILENVAISQVICIFLIKSLDHLEGVTLKDNILKA